MKEFQAKDPAGAKGVTGPGSVSEQQSSGGNALQRGESKVGRHSWGQGIDHQLMEGFFWWCFFF